MSAEQTAAPQWWLLQDGAPAGPFAHAEIINQLKSGRLSLQSLASPVGTIQWRTLSDWNCFSNARGTSSTPEPGPQDINTEAPPVRVMPDMANWLCIYGLFVSPALWLMNKACCLVSTLMFADSSFLQEFELMFLLVDFPVTLAAGSLLFVGSLLLRQRKRIGIRFYLAGLCIDFGWFVMSLITLVVLLGCAASEPGVEHMNTTNDSSVGLDMALCGLGLAAGIFELVGMVWLLTRGKELNVH